MQLPLDLLLPTDPGRKDKDMVNRIAAYTTWAAEQGVTLDNLRLEAYRDYLLKQRKLSPNTVRAHLSTIRGRFNDLLDNQADKLEEYLLAQGASPEQGQLLLAQVIQAIRPSATKVKVVTPGLRNKRLTTGHINQLLASLEVQTLRGLRDTAVIALMVTTGIREQELCGLDVKDLHQSCEDGMALRLRLVTEEGTEERFIPYGPYAWVVEIVDTWLKQAQISEGPLFRGFYKGGQLLRDNRLSARAVETLVAAHPILLYKKPVILKPLDLRHAYARNRYQQGVDMDTLAEYLGLKTTRTVHDYVRDPRYVRLDQQVSEFEFDLARLDEAGTEKGGDR